MITNAKSLQIAVVGGVPRSPQWSRYTR